MAARDVIAPDKPREERRMSLSVDLLLHNELYYPRARVDEDNVTRIREALRLGEKMPPLVVDAESRRIVDGVHRWTAYRREYGPEHKVDVLARVYANEAERLADAIALNVGHALNLSNWDILRSADLAEQVGLPLERLAQLVKWRPEKLFDYRASRMGRTLDDRRLALKRSIRHKLSEPLNPAQEQANAHLSGMQPAFHANQLTTLIGADLLPRNDETLRTTLIDLARRIIEWASPGALGE